MVKVGLEASSVSSSRTVRVARAKILRTIVLLFLVVPVLAYAASGGHGEGHVPSVLDLKYPAINFILYLLAVFYLVSKIAPSAWGSRRQRIITAIEGSRSRIALVEARVNEANQKLSLVDQEAKRLTALIQEEGTHEAKEMLEAAHQSAQRAVLQAKSSAEAEQRAAERGARRQLIERALRDAEAKLKRTINAERDRELRDRSQRGVQALVH